MWRIVMRQHSPLAACLYNIQHCFYQWSLMIFAFISGWKEFLDCFPLLVCQITFVICCFIFFFHFSYYITFSLWAQALRRLFSFSNALIRFLSCWFSSAIFRTCLHKRIHVSFRQILLHTAWKILAGRQPACVFLPCLQQNYARKSTYISCEDRF